MEQKKTSNNFRLWGCAEAIIYFLKLENIKNITVVNRTKKAKEIIKKYKNINFTTDFDINVKEAGLIINTTSLGMIGYPDLKVKLIALIKRL